MAQPAQTTTRRSAGAALLAVPLLAVLVLAGIGTAASLRAGTRAERVRGLVPFTGALTTLVHELQRERGLSTEASPAGPALEAARVAVDGAAVAHRDAAVRLESSDRDRHLHQRLDTGLAQLAELPALRASVDDAASGGPAAAPATVFRRYTGIIGGLLAVGGEIGLHEAGQDARLLRAVTAATAFSRARELADRERAAAAAGGVADPAERTRLAALGGRQDALLDQFAALASPEQLARYRRAFPDDEVERAGRLRRAALEGGLGQAAAPDLPGWPEAATARVERMREVELGLTGEVAHLAGLADQAADRRVLAYATVLFLALSALVILLVLISSRARQARTGQATPGSGDAGSGDAGSGDAGSGVPSSALPVPGTPQPRPPLPSSPVGERSPTAKGGGPVVHSPTSPASTSPAPTPPNQTPPTLQPALTSPPLQPGLSPSFPSALPPALPAPAEPAGVAAGPRLADLARRSQELVDQQLELLEQVGRDQADPRLPGRLLQVDRLAVRARRNAHNLIVLAGGEPGRRWDGPVPLAEVAALAVRDNPDAPRVDLDVPDDLLVPGWTAHDLANLLAELVDNATAFSAPETRVRVGGQKVGSGYVLEVEDHGLGMTDGELDAVNRRLAGDPAAGDDPSHGLGTWVAGCLAKRHELRVQLRRSPYGGVTALVFLPERLVTAQPAPPPVDDRGPDRDDAPAGRPGQVRSMLTRYRSGLERGRAAAARDLPDDPDGGAGWPAP